MTAPELRMTAHEQRRRAIAGRKRPDPIRVLCSGKLVDEPVRPRGPVLRWRVRAFAELLDVAA